FLMGDQPYLEPRIIDALIDAHQGGITLPAVGGQRRNPVIFDRQFYPDILALAGDTGARAIIEANRARVTAVPFEAERPFADIDKAEDLDRLARSRP
ncbi:MAG: NTP transferase domain-containing protein, partial [Rhodospirillales bacterium]|nr:NTP transferase domain-containing protein [Rhodospirillales bacterium]